MAWDRRNVAISTEAGVVLEKYINAFRLKPKIKDVVEAALEEYYERHPAPNEMKKGA